MASISKRDFLKTIPAAVPATMIGGLAGGLILPASAHQQNQYFSFFPSSFVPRMNSNSGMYFVAMPRDIVIQNLTEPFQNHPERFGNRIPFEIEENEIDESEFSQIFFDIIESIWPREFFPDDASSRENIVSQWYREFIDELPDILRDSAPGVRAVIRFGWRNPPIMVIGAFAVFIYHSIVSVAD